MKIIIELVYKQLLILTKNINKLFKKMKIWIFNAQSEKTKKFEKLMKTKWREDFIEDFHGEHISDHNNGNDFKIYITYDEDTVLWWLIIWERNILNNFKDPLKTERKFELQKEWYKNLTYVIVDEKLRKSWIATSLLTYATQENDSLWLTCLDELIPFYERNKFVLHMKRIEWEKVNLMIYRKSS